MLNDLVEVHVVDVPVALWQRASAHQEAIQREFDIIKAELPEDAVPHQLDDLIADFDRRFGGVSDPTWEDMYAAAERGDDTITLVFQVPVEVAAASEQLEEMLDRVDAFCREGEELLTLATPPELVAFRRWFLGEFTRQINEGLPPLPWGRWDDSTSRSVPSRGARAAGEANRDSRVVRFEGDLDLATAGALRDELLEIRSNGTESVVVDLSEVKFVDSVGLSLLMTAHNRLEEDGVAMRLVLPEKLRLLFEISGLTELLNPEFVGQEERPAPTGDGA